MYSSACPYRKWVCLCVEDPFVQGEDAIVVCEQEEQVFECFSKKEALHFVPEARIAFVLDISYRGVAAIVDPCVRLESPEDLPPPVAIFLLFRQSVHDEERFHCFWPEQIVGVLRLQNKEHKKEIGLKSSGNSAYKT